MSPKLSERLFIAEAVLLGLPLTALLGLELSLVFRPDRSQFRPWGVMDMVIVLAAVATGSGWRLLIAAIGGGAEALRKAHVGWWLAASLGCVLVLAAIVSMVLPPSPEYSPAATFRGQLESCILGLPLVAVLVHLWAEARFRKSDES